MKTDSTWTRGPRAERQREVTLLSPASQLECRIRGGLRSASLRLHLPVTQAQMAHAAAHPTM